MTQTIIPPVTIRLHLEYCDEHIDNHWIDQCGTCYGDDFPGIRTALLEIGYYYLGHRGGAFVYQRKYHAKPTPLDWQMLDDEHRADMFDNRDF